MPHLEKHLKLLFFCLIKRRTRVMRVFPNEQSCLRLISAILMEASEEWEYGRLYLRIESS